eukprot:TRINITY_DN4274_c0_g1_i1.p1 TRINITY_DN4274_c0_g1~~TRINITY_DN4274_c0_g1_i1.p1  ORF type:complete len:365 (+),score=49.09 TRINITY_DN4274_c0_g1_i1:184-1278(+)
MRKRAKVMASTADVQFKAYASPGIGKAFEPYVYTPEPLGDHDVEIRITHNGLCHTDLHMRDNDWGNAMYPLVAGHEVVGVVEAFGSAVRHLKIGQRVAYGWLRNSCRSCSDCVRGQENVCQKGYTGLILGGNKGGFQERLRAPADFAIPVPDGVESADAAPLMCAGVTVYQPIRTHWKAPGMKVGVLAIGGLGHLALQFARAMGGEVTAFSTSASKEAEARSFGAHHFVVYDPKTPVGKGYGIKPEERVELLINCSPVLPPEGDFQNQMSLLVTNGTLVLTGIPPAALARVSLLDIVFHQKKLAGSIVGGRSVLKEMFEFCGVNKIRPQIQIMKLSELNEALQLVHENKARYRIVLESDPINVP